MHYAFTDHLIAEIAEEMEVSPRRASDIVDHLLAGDRDRRHSERGEEPRTRRPAQRRSPRRHQ